MKPLLAVMRLSGLTEEKARECLNNQKLADAIVAITKSGAQETHLTGVPTFVIAGKVYGGELTFDDLKQVLDSLSPAEAVPASAWAHTGTMARPPPRTSSRVRGLSGQREKDVRWLNPTPARVAARQPCR